MPFAVSEERVALAERELGRRFPRQLRQRLMRDNGGEVTAAPVGDEAAADFDPYWELHPVWDDGNRKRAARTASHVVRETTRGPRLGWVSTQCRRGRC
jgi:cell wall assembly regulator SMI1